MTGAHHHTAPLVRIARSGRQHGWCAVVDRGRHGEVGLVVLGLRGRLGHRAGGVVGAGRLGECATSTGGWKRSLP